MLTQRVPIDLLDDQDRIGRAIPVQLPAEPEANVEIASPSAAKAISRTFTPVVLPAPSNVEAPKPEPTNISMVAPKPIEQVPQRTPISPLQQKTAEDSARLAYLQKSGSGIDQMLHPVDVNGVRIQNPHVGFGKKLAAVAARIGDVAGTAFFPSVMEAIPGTTLHHNELVNQAAGRVATDYGQQKTEQDIASKEAEEEQKRTNAQMVGYDDPDTGEHYELPRAQYGKFVAAIRNANARADKASAPVLHETAQGLVMVNPQTKEVTPLMLNGQPLMPKTQQKPDTPEQQFIDEYQKNHPHASIAEAISAYGRATQKPEREPKQLAIGPDGKVIELRPGMTVEPGTKSVKQMEQGPTADEIRRADLGNNMLENLAALEEIVKRKPQLFGPVSGRMTSLKGAFGTDDPDIAKLKAIHEYLGMASVGAHAMRNAQHVSEAADAVMNGYKNSPKAILAAINQARASVQTFLNDAGRSNQAVPQAKNTVQRERRTGTRQPDVKNDPLRVR